MFDWEETGAANKESIKMAKVPAERVKKSIETWLPNCDRRSMQASMEALGGALAANEVGFWGKMEKAINRRFSINDKKRLKGITNKIMQFYKATKSGGRRKRN